MLQHQRADALALMFIEYCESDLGAMTLRSRADDVSSYTDERALGMIAKGRHKRYMVDEIDLGHANRFILAERSFETMEAEVHRIRTLCKFFECLGKTLTVVGMNCSDRDRTPIR